MAWLAAAGAGSSGAAAGGAAGGATAAGAAGAGSAMGSAGMVGQAGAQQAATGLSGSALSQTTPSAQIGSSTPGGFSDFYNGAKSMWGGKPLPQSTTDTLNFIKPNGVGGGEQSQKNGEQLAQSLQQWMDFLSGH